MSFSDRILANFQRVRQRIADAAARAGRTAGEVRLVAVTKYASVQAARLLVDAGCRDLGAGPPQDLWQKAEELAGCGICWHLVGHLQRNKIRRTLPLAEWIHSIDSWKLLAAVDRIAGELDLRPKVLLEINISGESTKHGLPPGEAGPLLQAAGELTHVHVRGLMGMAALEGGPDLARRNFADLRRLRDRLGPACPEAVHLDELSMGMSGDFEIAIEEGATVVRIGSALLEGTGLVKG